MAFKALPLSSLVVNRANDRHGELTSEDAAIAWLFAERNQHMRGLAKDIVKQGEVYELPLVISDKNKYIVFDGNRRVTCMKLLEDPRKAPSMELRSFFEKQRALWPGKFPEKVSCQIESDLDRIDEILYRRHTGAQRGIGQSRWDDRMKNNFVMRTGKDSGPSVADEIEKRLTEASLLPSRRNIPRSTLNRLLSSEPIRQRVGVSMKGGEFNFVRDPSASLHALEKVANDLANRNVVLADIWNLEGKLRYLDKLESEGVLPRHAPSISVSSSLRPTLRPPKIQPSAKLAPSTRENLIPRKDFGIVWTGQLQRHHQIWEELQFHLEISKHGNAISVLLRVLIEISLEHYIKKANVQIHVNDKLAIRLKKAGSHLQFLGKIDTKEMDIINKFGQGEKLISADTLNKYVHSSTFAPSPDHLAALWDSLSNIIVHFLME